MTGTFKWFAGRNRSHQALMVLSNRSLSLFKESLVNYRVLRPQLPGTVSYLVGGEHCHRVVEGVHLRVGNVLELASVHENVDERGVPEALDVLERLLQLDGHVVLELVLVEGAGRAELLEIDHVDLAETLEIRLGVRVLAQVQQGHVRRVQQVQAFADELAGRVERILPSARVVHAPRRSVESR